MIYERYANTKSTWQSISGNNDNLYEWVSEEIILNCPLFEVEYEPEPKIWRAEYNKEYDFITDTGKLVPSLEGSCSIDTIRHELGNYFHPQDDADEIEQVQKEIAEVYARSKARRAK